MFRLLPLVVFSACIVAPGGTEPSDTASLPPTSATIEEEVGDCGITPVPAMQDVRTLPILTTGAGTLASDIAVRAIHSTADHDAWVAETGIEIDLSTVDFATETVAAGAYYKSAGCGAVETTLEVKRGDDDSHVAFDAWDHGAACATMCQTAYVDVKVIAVQALAGTVTACAALHGTCD